MMFMNLLQQSLQLFLNQLQSSYETASSLTFRRSPTLISIAPQQDFTWNILLVVSLELPLLLETWLYSTYSLLLASLSVTLFPLQKSMVIKILSSASIQMNEWDKGILERVATSVLYQGRSQSSSFSQTSIRLTWILRKLSAEHVLNSWAIVSEMQYSAIIPFLVSISALYNNENPRKPSNRLMLRQQLWKDHPFTIINATVLVFYTRITAIDMMQQSRLKQDFNIMFNKLLSRKTLPKPKELDVLLSSDAHTLTQAEKGASAALMTKSCNIKQTIATHNKSNPLAHNNKPLTSSQTNQQLNLSNKVKNQVSFSNKKLDSPSGPTISTSKPMRQTFGHKRSNSDGTQVIENKLLSRNTSVSSLFGNIPLKKLNSQKEQEPKCQELLKSVETIISAKFNVMKLSYENLLFILFELKYINFKSEEQFISHNKDAQLGILYKFWVNLTNSNYTSLQNLLLLLFHIEGVASKYPKIESRIKDFVQSLPKKQQDPKNVTYSEPEYRFIGIESISSWTNTGRLVIHAEESIKLKEEFRSMVDNRSKKGGQRVKSTTPIKKFYSKENTSQDELSNPSFSERDKNIRNVGAKNSSSSNQNSSFVSSNYKRKKVSSPYSDTFTQYKKVRLLKNREQMEQEHISLPYKTQTLSRSMKTQPTTLPFKPPRRSTLERLDEDPSKQSKLYQAPPSPKKPNSEFSKLGYGHRRVKSEQSYDISNVLGSKMQDEQRMNSSQKRIPLIYVDINLDNSHKQTIGIYDDDKSQTIAHRFALKHGLDREIENRLRQLIDQQMSTILGKIEQEELEEDTVSKNGEHL